ncbi:MAG TPA: hypothetical protein VGN47_03465 [Blastococcus sp.]|jgi:hypothetical protein|nr:hypothetical protein [Blastococcus sp.]
MSAPAASNSRFLALGIATVLCYAIGYPLALIAHSTVGWVLVFLGGPLLLTLGVLTIRRIAARTDDSHR